MLWNIQKIWSLILNTKKINKQNYGKYKYIKKLLEKKEEDYFLMLAILVSIITVLIDFALVIEFVKIINIL